MKRTYYPSKSFDDDLDALAQLAKSENWFFSGIDVAKLLQDAIDQRAERVQHDTLQAQFNKLHETFGLAQEGRYLRFSAALNAARGAFRNDKAAMAQLERFRRPSQRSAKVSAIKSRAA